MFSFAMIDQVRKKLEECTVDGKKLEPKKIFMCVGAPNFLINFKEKATRLFVDARVKVALGAECITEARTAEGTLRST